MIDFLFSLPLWLLAVVLNVWLMGFAVASLWAFRRWVLPRLRLGTDASLFYGAAVMQSAMVLYGLVAALTAVSVWSRHSQVSDIVSSEATAIASLWRALGGYPQGERDALRDVLRGYTTQIIHSRSTNERLRQRSSKKSPTASHLASHWASRNARTRDGAISAAVVAMHSPLRYNDGSTSPNKSETQRRTPREGRRLRCGNERRRFFDLCKRRELETLAVFAAHDRLRCFRVIWEA